MRTTGDVQKRVSCGADKLYLFNYMSIDEVTSFGYRDKKIFEKIYANSYSAETAIKAPRHHLVSFRDILPVGEKAYMQVPRTVSSQPDKYLGKVYEKFRIRTGKVLPESKARIIFTAMCSSGLIKDDVTMFFNCERVELKSASSEICEFSKLPLYEVEIPSYKINDINIFEISTEGKTFTIEHIELRIN